MSLNFGDILDAVAIHRGSAPVLSSDDGDLTWSEFDRRTNALARGLGAHGVVAGDKVCFMLFNGAPYVELLAACFKGRFVHVNANFRYTTTELAYILDNSDSVAMVYDARLAPVVSGLPQEVRDRVVLIEAGTETAQVQGAVLYEMLIDAHDGAPLGLKRSGDDMIFIYTGGTTGMPKGVMWAQAAQATALLEGTLHELGKPTSLEGVVSALDLPKAYLRPLVASPLMHGVGLFAVMTTFANGGHIIVTDNSGGLDAAHLWRLVDKHRADAMAIVGDTFARPLLAALETGAHDGSSMRLIGSSGVMWSTEVKSGLLARLPQTAMFDSLGSSEAMNLGTSVVTADSNVENAKFAIGAGCKVFDDDCNEVAPGSGQIGRLARPGILPLGYYKDEAKSAATFPLIDGVRYSIPGDLCTVEADGTIKLLGRGSQCINTGGEKVFPEEVELEMRRHPCVEDALVFGVDDPKWGQAVHAVVRLCDGSTPGPSDLQDFLRERLARYKVPKLIAFTDEGFRLANGKADYKKVRALI